MMMKFTFLRYTIYAALTYALMEFMRYDATITTDDIKFSESTLVEQGQNIFLILSLLFLAFTKGYLAVKYILILIVGLFFIREQDAFLDTTIAEHAWKFLCGIYAIVIGYKIYKIRKSIKSEVEEFIKTSPSGIIFLGFVTLLIFSRMFGRKKFWKAVEGSEDYTRSVKNAAEECTELFGYFLILVGIAEFYALTKSTVEENKFVTVTK